MTGATIANGAIVSSRYRRMSLRALSAGCAKKRDPARDAATQASAQTLAACVATSREKGVGGRNRGSSGIGVSNVVPDGARRAHRYHAGMSGPDAAAGSSRALPQPRAVVARLQRARARPRRGPGAAAARAGEVPRDLQLEPRRVLPGARVGPAGAARRRHPHARRPTGSTRPSSSARSGSGSTSSSSRQAAVFTKDVAPALEEAGVALRRLGRPRRPTTAPQLARGVRGARLPGAHAARRRPRAPVPVHLEPVAEPRGRRARPDHRRGALRPGQGAAAAPPLRRAARRRAVRRRSSR